LIRLFLAVSAFVGSWVILSMGFAIGKVNADFAVSSYRITTAMVVLFLAIFVAVLTFKKAAD
jgi:hydrogenase maturation factor